MADKENILFAIAEASLPRPSGAVREVVYLAVRGGEATLRDLEHEYKTTGPAYRRTAQTTLKASHTGHYHAGLIDLLGVLEFRSSNTAHLPRGESVPGASQHHWRLGRNDLPSRQSRPPPDGPHGVRGRDLQGLPD